MLDSNLRQLGRPQVLATSKFIISFRGHCDYFPGHLLFKRSKYITNSTGYKNVAALSVSSMGLSGSHAQLK